MPAPLPRHMIGRIDALERVGDSGGVVLLPDTNRFDLALLEPLHRTGPFGVHAYDRTQPPVQLTTVSTCAPGGEWLIADCPLRVPGGPVVVPDELLWAVPVIQAAIDAEAASPHWDERFVYVVAAHNVVTPGDTQRGSGWHADGIQGLRIRKPYPVATVVAWADGIPILVADQHFDVDDVDLSCDWINGWFEEQLDPAAVVTPSAGSVVAFSGYAVHADVLATREGWRSFVRVAFCNRVWDRAGNTVNAALGRYWPMSLRPLPVGLRLHPAQAHAEAVRNADGSMTMTEVTAHQVETAHKIGAASGDRRWFVPGARSAGSSVFDTPQFDGVAVDAHPGVMGAAGTDTALAGAWLASTVSAVRDRPLRVFDMTTGSGVLACVAAVAGADVSANDIDPAAASAAAANAVLNRADMTVTCGSGFDAVGPAEVFDVVVACPPYIDGHPAEDLLDHHGSGRAAFVGVTVVLDALFRDGVRHLAPGGVLAVTFAEWGDVDAYVHTAVTAGWNGETVARRSSDDGRRDYRLDLWRPAESCLTHT